MVLVNIPPEIGLRDTRCIIVDSTRRGKSMPDALSKTIPIWCAVINQLLFNQDSQSIRVHTPESVISRSEHSQIENRINGFVEEAKVSKVNYFRFIAI